MTLLTGSALAGQPCQACGGEGYFIWRHALCAACGGGGISGVMKSYLGEFAIDVQASPFAGWGPREWALYFIERYGSIDGAHHKTWVIAQVARILNGSPLTVVQARWKGLTGPEGDHAEYRVSVGASPEYASWVATCKAGEDGPDTYGWDEGIAP